MIYIQRIPTIDAYQVWTAAQVATLTGYTVATPNPGQDWAVEWRVGDVLVRIGGNAGDYLWLVDGYWNQADVATFEALWETPASAALRTTDLRESELRG